MIRKAIRRFLEVLAVFWVFFNLGAGYMDVFSCENECMIRLWLLCFGVCMLLFHNVYWRKKIKPCLQWGFVLPDSVLTHLSNRAVILGSASFFSSSVCVFSERLIITQAFSELPQLSCRYVLIYPLEQFGIIYIPGWWLPWWLSGKESACDTGATGDSVSTPGYGRSPGEGHDNPLQYACLENPMDRGAWRAMVHGIAQNRTWLKWLSMQGCTRESLTGFFFFF